MTRRLSRVAVATTLNPESQVKPVFMPSAPSNERSRPLCVTMRCFPRRISGFTHRYSYSGKSVSTARASLARSRAVVTWLGAGSPLGLTKTVRSIPSRFAVAFICSTNAGSLPEVVGDAAVLFDPADPRSIADGIAEALERADELASRGLRRAATFTWDATARAHDRVYEAVASA